MKKVLIFYFLSPFLLFSQSDTIFVNGEKIACVVKEIGTSEIKFSYLNESLINILYKNTIDKIVYKSGREQVFNNKNSMIKSIKDYDKIIVTQLEKDITGCHNLGQVTAKAKGATALANMKKVQDRAYKKLKIYAALVGGDIVFLTNENIIGNRGGSKFSPGTKTSTNLTGICYSRRLLNINNFNKTLNSKTEFVTINQVSLGANDYDYKLKEITDSVFLEKIYLDGDNIIVDCKMKEEIVDRISKESKIVSVDRRFKLIRFDNNSFTLMREKKSRIYNITILH